ncbi:MAG: DUF2891 domain-containing protein [Myxococcales bacterium]|nr:DUF2891 domain-containing protein [Myxococcales bacterium]
MRRAVGACLVLSTALSLALSAALSVTGCHARARAEPGAPATRVVTPRALSEVEAARFAALALACVHREYPNKIAHVLHGPEDVRPPHELTPAFFGCFDWHSAVHGHWVLARLARRYPDAAFAEPARAALARSLTPERIAGELAYLSAPERAGFERPYGLAWLLQLAAELREWDDPDARAWAAALAPLERLAVTRMTTWLPRLAAPIRVGEHSQTAFAMGLALDWARSVGDARAVAALREQAARMHGEDRGCNLAFEPSGHDFLSPCLAAADLMRRVLAPPAFAGWLRAALPELPEDGRGDWLLPARPADRSDGKLVHLDGLNLSRAWMLEGIARGLPRDDPRAPALRAAAATHREAGLTAVTGEHYAGGHWLGSFAVYLTTGRGLPDATLAG